MLGRDMDMPAGPIRAIIPGYEEAPRIEEVVRAAALFLPVLVVDDGSTDGTAEVAEAAGAEVIRQHRNAGKGAALRAGFRHALAEGCEAVVTLDADGQHDPGEIPAFLAKWERERPDLVIGRRDFRAMPPVRRLANNLGQRTFSWAVGRPIHDNQSGYRLVARRLMERLLESEEQGFAFEVEMITLAIRAGHVIEWVPIRTIYRGEPSHIRPWEHVTSFLRVSRDARRAVGTPLADASDPAAGS
jgi:glycosyltransferase involved in cell wall biosynthesis